MSLKCIATYRLLAVGPLQSEIETEVHFASLMVGSQVGCVRCSLSRDGGGLLGLIFAGYVPLASQSPYPIINSLFCGQL